MDLVVGATGQVGGNIARRLLAQGRRVRILVRPASDYSQLVALGAEPAIGDLKRPETLSKALEGVETVVTTANSAMRGGDDSLQTVDIQGNRNLIDAAREAGVGQFVFTSVYGVTKDAPIPLFQAKALTEEHLRASGLDYTILAPTMFMDVWVAMIVGGPALSGQPVRIVGQGNTKQSFIAADDVAAFAVAAVGSPAARDRHLPLGGPNALSWREVVATFERALGRPIPIESYPPGTPIPGYSELTLGGLIATEMQPTIVDMTETARTFGVKQTSVEDFARRMAGSGGR